MSGGYFEYDQYKITQIADEIETLILHNGSQDFPNWQYPPDIIEAFKIAENKLREAAVYAQRIDWFVSGDDGEESFRERLASDLRELKPYPIDGDDQQPT